MDVLLQSMTVAFLELPLSLHSRQQCSCKHQFRQLLLLLLGTEISQLAAVQAEPQH